MSKILIITQLSSSYIKLQLKSVPLAYFNSAKPSNNLFKDQNSNRLWCCLCCVVVTVCIVVIAVSALQRHHCYCVTIIIYNSLLGDLSKRTLIALYQALLMQEVSELPYFLHRVCPDCNYNLCEMCEDKAEVEHDRKHVFVKIPHPLTTINEPSKLLQRVYYM